MKLLVYVDNILIIGNNSTAITQFVQNLNASFITEQLEKKLIYIQVQLMLLSLLNQEQYIAKILYISTMASCKPILTPFTFELPLDSTSQQEFENPQYY